MALKHATLLIVSILISKISSQCAPECESGKECININEEYVCEST